MHKPYAWTEEVEDALFWRIANGESVRNICNEDGMPSWPTLRKRLIVDDAFATQYAKSKDAFADSIFEEVLNIADTSTPEDVSVARLRIDARKWMAGKMRPKVYGDKLDLDHTSSDGSMAMPTVIQFVAADADRKD